MCSAPVTFGGGIAMTNGSPSPVGRKKPASSHLTQSRSAAVRQPCPCQRLARRASAPLVKSLLRRQVVEVLGKLLGALARYGGVCARRAIRPDEARATQAPGDQTSQACLKRQRPTAMQPRARALASAPAAPSARRGRAEAATRASTRAASWRQHAAKPPPCAAFCRPRSSARAPARRWPAPLPTSGPTCARCSALRPAASGSPGRAQQPPSRTSRRGR